MAEIKSYTCDGPGCKNERGEANHWWMADKIGNALYISPWVDGDASRVKHYCGPDCVLKAVAAFMGEK